MRRLPVYFLIDVSESMAGAPIAEVEDGMRAIIQELRRDPYALETVHVATLVFAGRAETIVPLTELTMFYPPRFPIGSGTALGDGLEALMRTMDQELVKTTPEKKGDWKPLVFLFTDGVPTDDPRSAIATWNRKWRKAASLVCVTFGENADAAALGELTDTVLTVKETSPEAFREFFRWITASLKASSASVAEQGLEAPCLDITGCINLEKASRRPPKTDDTVVIIPAKCAESGRMYLIKYQRDRFVRLDEESRRLHVDETGFKLSGAYPIDEKAYLRLGGDGGETPPVDSSRLFGAPPCPCCGNQIGLVQCGACARVFCADPRKLSKCPWCGNEGELSESEESLRLGRARG